jgi:ribosomal protein L11 methyltransferase
LGRLTIVPSWEEYTPKEGEVVVRIDPGMAFGTGTHETTRLVMKILQDEICGGERVLDVGCGSGILSIAAAKLGAHLCRAYDIDPVAVRVAKENIEESGLSEIIKADTSDLLASVERVLGGYDLCVANIVADIIKRMLPEVRAYLKTGAKLILSGIVAEREDEVRAAAEKSGFRVLRAEYENDWVALLIA